MDKKDIFEICEKIFVKCVYSAHLTVTPSWRHSNEKTSNCNLVLICDGQGLFTLENETRIVNPGDIIFFPVGVKRSLQSNNGILVFRSINFKYIFINDEHGQWHINNELLPFEFVRHISDKALLARIEQLFVQIQKYYFARQYNSDFHMRYYTTELIALLLSDKRSNITYSEQNMIENSVKYMSTHFRKKITLDTLAELSGKGISYYGKVFKKITGVTPIKYLLNLRIDYSKELLESGFSITEACELSGFESLHYFSRAFKQKEKVSPREYVSIYKRKQ